MYVSSVLLTFTMPGVRIVNYPLMSLRPHIQFMNLTSTSKLIYSNDKIILAKETQPDLGVIISHRESRNEHNDHYDDGLLRPTISSGSVMVRKLISILSALSNSILLPSLAT